MYGGGSLRFVSPAIITSAVLALGVLISPAGAAPAGETGLGLIANHEYSAPYETLRVKT